MQIPLKITVRDMPHSEALDARIRAKAVKLGEFHPNITSCRVTVEKSHRHQRQGEHFQVVVDVRVPGREFVANRDHDEEVYVALREAFGAVRRQLDEHISAGRDFVKVPSAAREEQPE